jgi:hypothetical protein
METTSTPEQDTPESYAKSLSDLPREVLELIFTYIDWPHNFAVALSLSPSIPLVTSWICTQSRSSLYLPETHSNLFDWSNLYMWKSVSVELLKYFEEKGVELTERWSDVLHCAWRYKKWDVVAYAFESCYGSVYTEPEMVPPPCAFPLQLTRQRLSHPQSNPNTIPLSSTTTTTTLKRKYPIPDDEAGFFMEKAVRENILWIARTLLQHEDFGEDLLYWFMRIAMQNESFEMVDVLIEHGLDIMRRHFFNTLARFGSTSMMKYYIAKGWTLSCLLVFVE